MMETVLAPVTFQVNFVSSPNMIAFGLAEKLLISGAVVLTVERDELVVSTAIVTDLVILVLPLSAVSV